MSAESNTWYYLKEGMIDNTTVGPINEDEVAKLIALKTIEPTTLLLSPEVTSNNWQPLSALDFSNPVARYKAIVEAQRKQARENEENRRRLQAEKEAAEKREHAAALQKEEFEQRQQQKLLEQAKQSSRRQYLESVQDLRREYKLILADSATEAEDVCNHMGFEGWVLEQSFTDVFTYQQCCGTNSKRQFVLIFSQPLSVQ